MIQEAKLFGSLANFAPAGRTQVTPTPTGGPVVSSSFIPDNAAQDASSASLWAYLGTIASIKEMNKPGTTTDIFRPSPGGLRLNQVLKSKFKRTFAITVEDCSNVMFTTLRRAFSTTTPLTGTLGQYVPGVGGNIQGWLKLQSYNQDTQALEDSMQVWGDLQIDEATYGGDKHPQFTCTFTELYSTLASTNGA